MGAGQWPKENSNYRDASKIMLIRQAEPTLVHRHRNVSRLEEATVSVAVVHGKRSALLNTKQGWSCSFKAPGTSTLRNLA